ncbi:MAG: hypothetical protein ACTSRZ_11025 [Promethearchaeota archaeon]
MVLIRRCFKISVSDAKAILNKFKKNMKTFIENIQDKRNKDYKDYLKSIKVLPEQNYNLIVRLPDKTQKNFNDIPIEYSFPPGVEIRFEGLIIEMAKIDFIIPTTLIGEKFTLPTCSISTKTYKPWIGNIGLAWEGLTGVKGKLGFYPYESKLKMKEDIKKYFSENIVDPLCDFINNFQTDINQKLFKSIQKYANIKKNKAWFYLSPYDAISKNIIKVPIRCEYSATSNSSNAIFQFFCVGQEWPLLSDIILNILLPISQATAYFNDEGEMLSPEELEELFEEISRQETLTRKIKKKEKSEVKVQDNWDPFKPVPKVKRDEFGFIMDAKRDDSEFGSKELTWGVKQIKEAELKKQKELKKAEIKAEPVEPQDVSRWPNPNAWYNELQFKTFTVKGDRSQLSFKERGEINMILGCGPPFMLRFARDNIRVKYNMLGGDVIKLLFKYYKKGYLRIVK